MGLLLCFSMTHEPRAVHFEDEVVVDDAYLAAGDELDLALLALWVYADADDGALLDLTCAGDKLDVEGYALYLLRSIGRVEALALLTRPWVYPLELLGVVAQQGVTEGGGLLWHFTN